VDIAQTEFRFLFMDERKFVSREELQQQIRAGGLRRRIANGVDRILVAYGNMEFTEEQAIALARELGFEIQKTP